MRYTADELRLMATLAAKEDADRFADEVLHDQHDAAKTYAAEHGGPVQGVCPTMFRNPQGRVDDGIDCADLAKRLKEHAEEVGQGGVYR